MDELNLKVNKIEDDILYFTSKTGDEMTLFIPAIKDSVKYVYNQALDKLQVITWDEVFNAIISGDYLYVTNNTVKFITCKHSEELVPIKMNDDWIIYACPTCRHIFIPLEVAINAQHIVASPDILELDDNGYYVLVYKQAVFNKDNSVDIINIV